MSTVAIDEIGEHHTGARLRFEGGEGVLLNARRTRRGTKLTMSDESGRHFELEASDLEFDVISMSDTYNATNASDLEAFVACASGAQVPVVGMWCDERECRIAAVMFDEPIFVAIGEYLTYDGVRFAVESQAVTARPSAARTYRRR